MDMKAVRKQLGLTQTELGALVFLTDRQIRNVESGRSAIQKLVAEKIVMLLAAKSATQESATEKCDLRPARPCTGTTAR